jgi:carbon monoxide dehydrogenase subunit G
VEEGKRYTATMVEKVGPFKVEFPTTIEVLERAELSHIKAQASGADNKIGSRMKIDLDVNLREQDNTTVVSFVAGVDILGKLAALGHGIIKRKADQVLDEFAQAVKTTLEGDN